MVAMAREKSEKEPRGKKDPHATESGQAIVKRKLVFLSAEAGLDYIYSAPKQLLSINVTSDSPANLCREVNPM